MAAYASDYRFLYGFTGLDPVGFFHCYFEKALVDGSLVISNLKLSAGPAQAGRISRVPTGVGVKNGNTVYGTPMEVGLFSVRFDWKATKTTPGKQRGNSSWSFYSHAFLKIDKSYLYLNPVSSEHIYDGSQKTGKFYGGFIGLSGISLGSLNENEITFEYSPSGKNQYTTARPINVGAYDVRVSTPHVSNGSSNVVIVIPENYVQTLITGLVIKKINISNSIQITGLSKTYTGQSQGISGVTMTPANQPYTVSYTPISVADVSSNADTGAPTAAGTYQVVVNVDGGNYSGTKTETLTINKATATAVVLAGAKKYTGAGLAANFSAKLGSNSIPVSSKAVISATYNGVASLPINAGTYQVAVTINDPNYTATGTGTFTISPEAPKLLSDTLFKMSAKVGRLATYQIVSTDPLNRPITSFNCKNLPLSLSLNPDTGFITGVIDFFGPKSFTVAVSGPGGEANGTLTIEGLADTIFLGEASPIDTFGDAQKIYLGGRLLYP